MNNRQFQYTVRPPLNLNNTSHWSLFKEIYPTICDIGIENDRREIFIASLAEVIGIIGTNKFIVKKKVGNILTFEQLLCNQMKQLTEGMNVSMGANGTMRLYMFINDPLYSKNFEYSGVTLIRDLEERKTDELRESRILELYNMKAKKINPSEQKIIKYVNPIIEHIKSVICDDNEGVYTYVMKWLYALIFRPWNKLRCALLLYGESGQEGKSIFLNFLCKYIIGKTFADSGAKWNGIFGKFNHIVTEKLLIIIDEVPESKEFNDNNRTDELGMFKTLVTNEDADLQQKGVDQKQVRVFSNFILTTNYYSNIPLKAGTEQRLYPIRVSSKRSDVSKDENVEYWKRIVPALTCQTNADYFVGWLFNQHQFEEFAVRPMPLNQYLSDLLESSKDPISVFLEDYKETDGSERILCNILLSQFKNWCRENGHQYLMNCTSNKFTSLLNSKRIQKHKSGPERSYHLKKI